jgi:DHA2 family multidrug resistance protein
MVTTIIGGRLVDRIGVRAVMIPGLLILGFATWQLTSLSVYSPFWWIQTMLILRGLALGLSIQPLTVAMLAEIPPRQLAQASSLSTVNRAVASSLGIAIVATLVQTQAKVHYTHLAEQVTASSPLGQLMPNLQAYFVAQGADLHAAYSAALQIVSGLLQRNSYVLAIQDAFVFNVAMIVLAIIATLLVRESRRLKRPPQQGARADIPVDTGEVAPTESALAAAAH